MKSAVMSFRYSATDMAGRLTSGRLDVASRDAAIADLARRGLMPIALDEVSASAARRPELPAAELALGLRVLADLLESGIPVSRALAALETMTTSRWRAALPGVREAVREGQSLARALEGASVEIPRVVTGLLQAGERGTGLPAAVRRAAEVCEESAATRAAIRNALAYPMLLAVAGTASVALLVGIVLPRFADILQGMGQVLPASTQLVLRTAELARLAALPGAAVLALLVVGWRVWTGTDRGRCTWHALLLTAPVVGDTRRAAAAARFCTTLSALLEAGVPIAAALPHAGGASGDAAVAQRAHLARALVLEGERLSRALERHDAVTSTVVRLTAAGEESGRLAALLAHAGRMERARAAERVRALVRVIEPALIIGFGGVVAVVAASLLQALYSVRPAP